MTRRRPGRFGSGAPLAVSQVDAVTWETTAPLIFHSSTGRTVEVPIGSTTDWASRPRVVAWLISNMVGAPADVVHDDCWRHKVPAGELTYAEADALLEEMLAALDRAARESGKRRDRIPAPTRWLMWTAVRWASIIARPGGAEGMWRDLPRMVAITLPGLLLASPAVFVLPPMALMWIANHLDRPRA